ncbi:NAD(P)-dependent oxidoreductase [Mucilaginibacter sp. dw_454]|uniref:NAD(P)-dependent oxidoreductase n=1 Tax=Mucilaginibacter sp. dw_454 TaxID=2720079 RepID=UPI001BD3C5F4|nr:NAD(P)-dependent oxidoreductase [Mucilaginibacter sp. dw_454]
MKIAVFGASGRIGSRIVQEALNRGHDVTAIVRHPQDYTLLHDHLKVAKGNLFDRQDVETGAFDQDAVVCAYSNTRGAPASTIAELPIPLIKGLKQAQVKRLIVVGGAGSLEVAPGTQLVDTPNFPVEYKSVSLAHRDALKLYQNEKELDWTYISPAAEIAPGERTGKFRLGGTKLLSDEAGKSFITMEDYAIAVVDEIENPTHIREQMTVAY